MNQNKQAPRRRMTRREWRIRRCLRLARNWAVFLAACGAAVALMTSGILWLLPKAHALIAGPEAFVARNYDDTEYQLNLADARLVLVNGNLPLDAEPAPALAVADDATGQQLEAEAAEQYRAMAAAAAADGITLELVTGYQDVSAREAAFDARKQVYLEKGLSEEEAAAYAASVCGRFRAESGKDWREWCDGKRQAPSHTLSPMVIGNEYIPSPRCSGSMGCPVVHKVTFGPINTFFPMVIFQSSISVRFILE